MRVGARVFVLWCFLAPVGVLAAEQSPHELYDAINALTVDSSQSYRLVPENRIELRRGDAVISLEEGTLAFFSPLDGRITGAVFSGRGHVLAVPRDPVEKQQMGRFLGAPILDQTFASAYLRFSDEMAVLTRIFHPQEAGNIFYGRFVRRISEEEYLLWIED